MNWYLARRLTEIRVAGRLKDYEEGFFVLQATSLTDARRKATVLARREETSYKNVYGQSVHWRLHRILDVSELSLRQFRDGTWLHARAFPRVSRLGTKGQETVLVNGSSIISRRGRVWYGAMLLFRNQAPRPHDEERLLILRADDENQATEKALIYGCDLAKREGLELVGTFQAKDILGDGIRDGTEVYYRFFQPYRMKGRADTPRGRYLTTARFRARPPRAKASA